MSASVCSARVLWSHSLPGSSFRELVEVAAASGHDSISISSRAHYVARNREGLTDADLRAILDEHRVRAVCAESVGNWLPGVAPAPAAANRYGEAEVFAMAEALGAPLVLATAPGQVDLPFEAVAEAFAGLCDRAALRGLRVGLEAVAWMAIRDVATSWRIVETAGRANGGIVFDSWHHFRTTNDGEALRRIPGERVFAVQFADAPALPEDDIVDECLWRRRLPGEGGIDFAAQMRTFAAMGVSAPMGMEWFDADVARRSAQEAADHCARALDWLLAGAAKAVDGATSR